MRVYSGIGWVKIRDRVSISVRVSVGVRVRVIRDRIIGVRV